MHQHRDTPRTRCPRINDASDQGPTAGRLDGIDTFRGTDEHSGVPAGEHAPRTCRFPRGARRRTRIVVAIPTDEQFSDVVFTLRVIRTDVPVDLITGLVSESQAPWKYVTTTEDACGLD